MDELSKKLQNEEFTLAEYKKNAEYVLSDDYVVEYINADPALCETYQLYTADRAWIAPILGGATLSIAGSATAAILWGDLISAKSIDDTVIVYPLTKKTKTY